MALARPGGRFPKAARVRKRLEFEAVQAHGRRVTTADFVLLLLARSEGESVTRLGIIASRKVGTSVSRNRAKRLVREAFRATRDLWQPGMDLVVIVRRPLNDMKLDRVVAQWRDAAAHVARRTSEAKGDLARRSAASC